MARLEPNIPEASAKPRLGGLRVMSGITFKNRNVLRWRHPLEFYWTHKTLFNGWKQQDGKGIFTQMMVNLTPAHGEKNTLMIDVTYLKEIERRPASPPEKGV